MNNILQNTIVDPQLAGYSPKTVCLRHANVQRCDKSRNASMLYFVRPLSEMRGSSDCHISEFIPRNRLSPICMRGLEHRLLLFQASVVGIPAGLPATPPLSRTQMGEFMHLIQTCGCFTSSEISDS